jgi:hypothetical protein
MFFPVDYPIVIHFSGTEFNFATEEGPVSMEEKTGTMTTIPFKVRSADARRVAVNADRLVSGTGSLRVAILDGETVRPLPEFTANNCDPLIRDGVAIPVNWSSRRSLLGITGKRIRFRFAFSGTGGSPRLCALRFE